MEQATCVLITTCRQLNLVKLATTVQMEPRCHVLQEPMVIALGCPLLICAQTVLLANSVRIMHRQFLRVRVQKDGSAKEKLTLPPPQPYQSTQETVFVQPVTTVSKERKHQLRVQQAHSVTAQVHDQSMTVWTALLVSSVMGTITRFQLDLVHQGITVLRVPEPMYPSPMDICARLGTSVREALQTQRSVMQVPTNTVKVRQAAISVLPDIIVQLRLPSWKNVPQGTIVPLAPLYHLHVQMEHSPMIT